MAKRPLLIALTLALAIAMAVGVVSFINQPRADEGLERAVMSRPSGGASEAFARADVTAERVCVFGPYSTDAAIADELGFEWSGTAQQTGIGSLDTHELVVAADLNRVIAWAMVPRGSGSWLLEDAAYGCEPVT